MTKETIFSLPKPVRDIIWEMTITSRVLSLQYRRVFHTEYDNIHRTFPIRLSPQANDTCSFLYILCNDISSITTLSICQDSRKYALSRGYRAWNLQDMAGRTRSVMWNPVLDTVFLDGLTQKLGKIFFYDDTIIQQFPVEVSELRFLAVLSSHWPTEVYQGHWQLSPDQRLPKVLSPQFNALTELCVVFDAPYESAYVQKIESSPNQSLNLPHLSTSWQIPADIENEFKIEKARMSESQSNVPKVRFVKNQNQIIDGSGESAILRCFPCPYLFKLMQWWKEWCKRIRVFGSLLRLSYCFPFFLNTAIFYQNWKFSGAI